MKNTLFLLLSIFMLSSCGNYYVPSHHKVSDQQKLSKKQFLHDDGTCWQQCLMPAIYKDEVTIYHVYTGDATVENVETEVLEIEITPARTEWEKRKKENCKGNKDDCYMYCFVKIPGEVETFTVLKDITQSDNYEEKKIVKTRLVKGEYIKSQQILCEEKQSKEFISNVQQILYKKDYKTGGPTKQMNAFLIAGLNKFQRDNKLPIGMLNLQTLDALGVDYEQFTSK